MSGLLNELRHELRTPLSRIVGYGDILLEHAGALDGTQADDLRRVVGAARDMVDLTDKRLDQVVAARDPARLSAYRHEFRNRLNQVIGYGEIIREDAEADGNAALAADLTIIVDAARELVDLVAGILTAETLERGTVARRGAAGLESVLEIPAPPASARVGTLGGMILVVDDNQWNRDLLSRRLRELGHAVETVDSGEAALEIMACQCFDLVLLDIHMPGMNGFQVLGHMKQDPGLRSVPVIVVSALDDISHIVTCIELGAQDFLPKPFEPALLRARVDACLEMKRMRNQEVSFLAKLKAAEQRANQLLSAIFPGNVVAELKATGAVQPRRHETVAVLFCDVVGFTPYCERHGAEEVVAHLREMVEALDELAERHGLEKIKTIGDAFLATCGLLAPAENPLLPALRCGLDMIRTVKAQAPGWDLRVGVEVGPVVAGVVGKRQYLFDVWGDTVNTAARIQTAARPGTVATSARAWAAVEGLCAGRSMGQVQLKGKGLVEIMECTGLLEGEVRRAS
ncbi:MAG TPA: adenylate/guanylate cyclase domain-containing protein [Azospirillaceae bacterium]|nr:adenylate/guanylate cyclase domain-containing protein [Azospirillaceae bacterium]